MNSQPETSKAETSEKDKALLQPDESPSELGNFLSEPGDFPSDPDDFSKEPDELPKDLMPAAQLDDYAIPNNSRRRVVGALYVFIGVVFAATWVVARNTDTALLNAGFLAAGLALAALGCHHIITGRELEIDDTEALKLASAAVPFELGHASAQMGWRGWLSRPTWKVLMYSNEPQPAQRALVRLDGFSGAVVDMLVEENPEDWSDLLAQDESKAS